jgi:hypothetical protein
MNHYSGSPVAFLRSLGGAPRPSEGFDIQTRNACSWGATGIAHGGLPQIVPSNLESSFYVWIVPQFLACASKFSLGSREGVDSGWGCRLPLLRTPAA